MKEDNKQDEKASETKELSVLSYNIWFEDQERDKRFGKMIEMISSDKPDIICLQEVTPLFMKDFFCKSNFIQENYLISDHIIPGTFGWYGNIIAINKSIAKSNNHVTFYQSKFEIIHQDVDNEDDKSKQIEIESLSNQGRSLISCKVKLCDNSIIWINTVHLESIDENIVKREKQLKLTLDGYMKNQIDQSVKKSIIESTDASDEKENKQDKEKEKENGKDKEINVLSMLMGDFNFDDGDPENEIIKNSSYNYNDCYLHYLKICKENNIKMNDRLTEGITQIYKPNPNVEKRRRLDKMLFYCNNKQWVLKKYDIIGEWNMPSDHLGIISYFESAK